jgi:hypothetical protein
MNSVEFSVPENMKFNVSYFNVSDQQFVPAWADQVCYDDHLDSGMNVTNCKIQVQAWTEAQGISLFEVTRDDTFGQSNVA